MLSGYEYIISKQVQWAKNRGLSLIGSKGKRGRPVYTMELEANLFAPLTDAVRHCFDHGNGNETQGSPESPAKIQALHSSSALGLNVFQYWESINQVPVISAACGFCRKGDMTSEKIVFEEKYPVSGITRIPPNIDIVIHNSEASQYKRFAIESKFTEPFQSWGKTGIKPAYLGVDALWEDIPELHQFARTISPENSINKHLDTAQLIKHILGLKSFCNKREFKLLYIYYDVLGNAGAIHRKEIDDFTRIAKSDGIHFLSLSYQALMIRLAKKYRKDHPAYVQYITERYL